MHCLKVSAADTKAQKIEASVENRFPVWGAFTSGLAILAHASQLEAQFQNLLSSPCCPYMDVCTMFFPNIHLPKKSNQLALETVRSKGKFQISSLLKSKADAPKYL